jgi:hypothetical protein
MIASGDHFRREPYLRKRGRVRAWTLSGPHTGTFARAGEIDMIAKLQAVFCRDNCEAFSRRSRPKMQARTAARFDARRLALREEMMRLRLPSDS